MKKRLFGLIALCSTVVLSSLAFAGCGNSNIPKDFTAVCSVEYLTQTENTKTLNSNFILEYDEPNTLTLQEFNSLDYILVYNYADKINMEPSKKTIYMEGATIKYEANRAYYSQKILSVKEKYIYIKIIDARRFEIIDLDNNRYLISTTYFKVEYFK